MRNLFLSGFIFMLVLSGCGYNGTPTRSPQGIVPLTSIEIVPVYSKLASSTSTRLKAYGNYAGVLSEITDQVTWASATTTVADFKDKTGPNKNRVTGGLVTADTTVEITASVGDIKATFPLTVSSATVTGITISTTTPTVHAGLTRQFAATGKFSDLTEQDLTFDATWSAGTSGFASISNDPASKGLATGLAIGTATITATFGTPPITSTPSLDLIVTEHLLQSITIVGPDNGTIAGISKTFTYTANGKYSDEKILPITATISWASSQVNFAKIDATSGVVTTVAVGTTTISATLKNADGDNITGTTNLIVKDLALKPFPNGLTISQSSLNLSRGGNGSLTVKANFVDNSTPDVTSNSQCQWSSSVGTIATVIAGSVTADTINTGQTTITATYGGQSVTAIVTVN